MSLKLFVHHHGLLIRHVGVVGSMNHDRRRILGRHILNRHEGIKTFWLLDRIPARDGLRPRAGLAAILIERAAIAFAVARVGDRRPADLAIGFFTRQFALLMTGMGLGLLYQSPIKSP